MPAQMRGARILHTHTHTGARGALFRELEQELGRRFHLQAEDEADVWREVVDGRLGGLEAWAEKARTKEVPLPLTG